MMGFDARPIVPHQCAYPGCKSWGVIYPEDDQFWKVGRFWVCSAECFEAGRSLPEMALEDAVIAKWAEVNKCRARLGF